MSAFTPGPWRVEVVDYSFGEDVYREVHGGPEGEASVLFQTIIRDVRRGRGLVERDKHNAALIAAAPDLLASLEEVECFVLIYCEQYARQHGLSSQTPAPASEWHPTHRAIWDRLKAAIARTKGAAAPHGEEGAA